MKNSVRKIAQIVSVIAALAIIGSVAFAYTNPTGPAPTGNVPAPVNTGTFMQTKLGDLGLAGTGTGNLFATLNGWFGGSVVANHGLFGLSPTSQTFFQQAQSLTNDALDVFNTTVGIPLRVDSTGKTIIAGAFAITSGSPAAGDVLTSDASGNATWQVPTTATSATPYTPVIEYIAPAGSPSISQARATCDAGYQLVGGGGSCDSNGIMSFNYPESTHTSWYVNCIGNASQPNPSAHAFAICMQTSVVPTTPVVTGPTWHDVPSSYGSGTGIQTCAQWLHANNSSFTVSATGGPNGTPNVRVGTGTTGNGSGYCAYGANTTDGLATPQNGMNVAASLQAVNTTAGGNSNGFWTFPAYYTADGGNVGSGGYRTQIYY